MRIGFIGLGNVGGKLAGSLLRNGYELTVHDVNEQAMRPHVEAGANPSRSVSELVRTVDMVITCLPSVQICREVMESADGVIGTMSEDQVWAEMSTTDQDEVVRLGKIVQQRGAHPIDCPVSGGCHRAATGNISIFAGCERSVFERVLPVLTVMGRRILHTGPLGSASALKVLTNYLATANLVTLCEALVTAKMSGLDLNTTYEAIRISSGNSFVHETESQVILNGSRDINFTMQFVLKDITLFQQLADRSGVPLEVSPLLIKIFEDGLAKYGGSEWSPNIVKRLEEACRVSISADGFPAEIVDDDPEQKGYEVRVN